MAARGGELITVQDVGIEIYSIWPADGAGNRIDGNPGERAWVLERFEHALSKDRVEVELAHQSVGEREAEPTCTEVLDLYDPSWSDHVVRLPKGFDGKDRLRALCSLPVGGELIAVQHDPLSDETCGCARKAAAKKRAVSDPHQRFVLAVDGMNVRRLVIGEVHVDHDAVELAQPRPVRGRYAAPVTR